MIAIDKYIKSIITDNKTTLALWVINRFDNVVNVENVVDLIDFILKSNINTIDKTKLIKKLISMSGVDSKEINKIRALIEDSNLDIHDLESYLNGYSGMMSESSNFIKSVNRILK